MSERPKFLPLAFALAVSLGGSSNEALNEASTTNFFQPGRLRHTLDVFEKTDRNLNEREVEDMPSRTAQWFNWFNGCISGYWRRC